MPDLTQPMSNEQIEKLDYFDKMQLYYNVYYNTPYLQIPSSLRKYYHEDDGLELVKAVLVNSNLKNPFEIVKLMRALKPTMPQTLQEIYNRAVYLAGLCGTSPEKIIRSNIFKSSNFIPELSEEAIQRTLKFSTVGSPIMLTLADYTPAEEETPSSSTPSQSGTYADETKVYFTIDEEGNISCSASYSYINTKSPKWPAAELVFSGQNVNIQNINNVSAWKDEESSIIYYTFIQIYNNIMKLYTIHYNVNNLTYVENELIIDGN